ncbi:c-type cytochrome [Polaribacter sp. Hel1_85]|uniref:c-type cytochrome n=1 Tax=Polaribacter sp. Hel1_85 TaxID=1250005 RepID=UPI000AA5EC96|nr:c-type cytochrome [Polaribacter sp. Hel1_85]
MKPLTLLIIIAFVFSCKDSQRPSYSNKKSVAKTQEHPGKKLMRTNCYVCHNPTTTEDNRIAPPMIAIKKHYIGENTTKEAFINSMQNWIKNPTQDNAKMYGAVRRFGLMPKQAYPEETIKQIADYMFDNEIEKPEWFDDHYNKERGMGKGRGKGMGMQKNQQ